MKDFHLLTNKPVMYICNVHESDIGSDTPHVGAVREIAAREGSSVLSVSAEVEEEIAELPEEERKGFLASLGLEESGLDRVIRGGYTLLQLITFFTANPKELRAWTVRRGTTAPEGAGEIHSDFQRGFIRAEVIRFHDLARLGTEQAVKDAGLLALEGKDYQIQDGDVIFFRFHVG
jgi:hypothetical protein